MLRRRKEALFAALSDLRCRSAFLLILHTVLALVVFNGEATSAEPPCKPIEHPNFALIPMRMAVVSESENAELLAKISYINNKQRHYELVLLAKNDVFAHVAVELDYDGILVFDPVMMSEGRPKYNRHLFTYRDQNLSDQTMIVDWRWDKDGRIDFAFMQVAAANARARKLLMELGLMALAEPRLMSNEAFLDYYEAIDRIVGRDDSELSQTDLELIMKRREEVILGCFLTGK